MIKEKVIEVLAQYKDCAPEEIDASQSFEN
jgi:hypothetical protein